MAKSGFRGLIMNWVLVPVKELTRSKQRLAGVLDTGERKGLVLAMLQDVLTAIREAAVFDGVLVVSRSRDVQALAANFSAEIFADPRDSNHSRAVTEANWYLVARHRAQSSLAISGDIPCITAKDIRQVVACHDRLTLVPNTTGEGTNAILASPPNAILSDFGGPSFRRHVSSAAAAGLTPSVVRNENIAFDIDKPRDLELAVEMLPPSFTRDYLWGSGIAERLNTRNKPGSTRDPRRLVAEDQWA